MTGWRTTVLALLTAGVLSGSAGADEPWDLIAEESRLGFVLHEGGHDIEGVFARFEADILFSPDNLAGSRIAVTVDVTSFHTGVADYDDAVGLPGWMDFATHPTAWFVADRFRDIGPDGFEALGTLTLRGTTRDIVLPFTFTIDGTTALGAGHLSLNRREFGIGDGSWETRASIGNAVDISFTVSLRRAAPAE
ncbi:MAG: YceI family protein [Azospirillaceae bacterium]